MRPQYQQQSQRQHRQLLRQQAPQLGTLVWDPSLGCKPFQKKVFETEILLSSDSVFFLILKLHCSDDDPRTKERNSLQRVITVISLILREH